MAVLGRSLTAPTAAAIFARHERDAKDWRRPHLGASQVGHDCARRLWYEFRWAARLRREGRMLRLLERGDREEAWMLEELRRIEGFEVVDRDPATGRQWEASWHGGHFQCHADGALRGVAAAPKTWHLLELKTANAERHADLRRRGVAAAAREHHVQCQVNMAGLGLERTLYLAVCKDDDGIYEERIRIDRDVADAAVDLAGRVIFAAEPPARIRDDPTWWQCKLCHHAPHCHGAEGGAAELERGCRTCASATPLADGTWTCEHWGRALSVDEQRAGCPAHLFVPQLLVGHQLVDYDPAARAARYQAAGGPGIVDRGGSLEVQV